MDRTTLAAALLLVFVLVAPTTAARFTTEVVAVSGEPAPDGNGILLGVSNPALNNLGQVAFAASLTNNGYEPIDSVIIRSDGTTLTQIARTGQAISDGIGTFKNLLHGTFTPALSDAGQVGFTASSPHNNRGIYISDGNAIKKIARVEDDSPDGEGRISTLREPVFGQDGKVVFEASVMAEDIHGRTIYDRDTLYYGDENTLTPIAREYEIPPNTDRFFDGFGHLNLSNVGEAAFSVTFYPSSFFDLRRAIFKTDGSTPTQLVRTYDPAPDGNGHFRSMGFFDLNNSGQVAFRATLDGTLNDNDDDEGLFVGDENAIKQVAREGDRTPASNGVFQSFGDTLLGVYHWFNATQLNDAGQVSFHATLASADGEKYRGIFLSDGTTLTEIAWEGQVGPEGRGTFSNVFRPYLNGAGQLAFAASITYPQSADDDFGFFLYDDKLGIQRIVSLGDSLLGSHILKYGFSTSSERARQGFNDRGQFAYRFELADGRNGIAIATLVPEPSTLTLLCLLFSAVFSSRSATKLQQK